MARETKAEKIRRCHESLLADEPHTFWNGVVDLTYSVAYLGRRTYPLTPILRVRHGHDRITTEVRMTWKEAELMHKRLSFMLKDRAKLVRLVERHTGFRAAPRPLDLEHSPETRQ
jgi:hypothetical protein